MSLHRLSCVSSHPPSSTCTFTQISARLTRYVFQGASTTVVGNKMYLFVCFPPNRVVGCIDYSENRVVDWYRSARWCPTCIFLTFRRLFGPRSSLRPTIQSQDPVTFTALTLVSILPDHSLSGVLYTCVLCSGYLSPWICPRCPPFPGIVSAH